MTFDLLTEMRQAAAEPQGNGEHPITSDDVFRWADEVDRLQKEIERLQADIDQGAKDYCALMDRHDEQHNEIERLREENERLLDIIRHQSRSVRSRLTDEVFEAIPLSSFDNEKALAATEDKKDGV